MKKIVSLILLSAFLPAIASASHPALTIVTNSQGCPTSVQSNDNSCNPNVLDGPNTACRSNGAAVSFVSSGNRVDSMPQKPDTPGQITCHPTGKGAQCIVKGNSGDRVGYSVMLQGCASLDPVIIIK